MKLKFLYSIVVTTFLVIALSSQSCVRRCKECSYYGEDPRAGFIYPPLEVPIGKVCGKHLDRILSEGYTVGDSTYAVHCE